MLFDLLKALDLCGPGQLYVGEVLAFDSGPYGSYIHIVLGD